MPSYKELRKEYTEFLYRSYIIEEDEDKVKITYNFEIPKLAKFAPTWEFPKMVAPKEFTAYKNFSENPTFINMVFSLGMVELVSYWKISCAPKVRVLCGKLEEKQIRWWKNLYFNGLGEFYYTNGIEENEEDFMEIVSEGEAVVGKNLPSINDTLNAGVGNLIPIGGGKDSAVTLTLLKDSKEDNYCYIINPRGATLKTVEKGGYDENKSLIAVKRTLDKNMLELNKQGFLNGHTPFSAIVAFSATIAAYMKNLKYIVLSNESSANESTVEGSYVNHQYSKSFKYEKDFHDYEEKYISSGTYYFSLLRPMSEFQIAEHFSKCTEYHDIFRSCNVGSKEDIWCGHCPKCLFVWLILSPFLSQTRLTEIFGRNMADDREMELYFSQLIGMEKEKPFECVGSRDEINAAVTLTIRDFESGINSGEELPYLFKRYKDFGMYEKHLDICEDFFNFYDDEHLIPEKYLEKMKKYGIKVS